MLWMFALALAAVGIWWKMCSNKSCTHSSHVMKQDGTLCCRNCGDKGITPPKYPDPSGDLEAMNNSCFGYCYRRPAPPPLLRPPSLRRRNAQWYDE